MYQKRQIAHPEGYKTARSKTGDSDIFLFSYEQRTIVPFLSKLISSQWENDWEICFSRGLESWNDVTIVASLLFLASRFCTPPEVKFDSFGTSKHGEGKSLSNFFLFALLISTLGRFNRGNKKKICHVHFNTTAITTGCPKLSLWSYCFF